MKQSFDHFFLFQCFKINFCVFNLKSLSFFIDFLFLSKNLIWYLANFLVDLFVTDYLYFKKRFRIVYNIYSFIFKIYFFINYCLSLIQSFVSVHIIFRSSIWLEREVYDMFGIKFINNWDLRRILTDYTFFGFPLRKDFPLSGYTELLYDERKKSTAEVLIELMQEMRFFIISSALEFWSNRDWNI